MAITVTAGTTGTGTTTANATVPTGTGGLLVICASSANSTGTAPTTPAGWTLAGSITSATGATAFGVDAGPRVATIFTKPADGTEATVTVAATGSGTTRATSAQMLRFVTNTAGFSVAGVFSSAAGPTANTTAYTATGSTSVPVVSGDTLLSLTVLAVDTATLTSPVLSTTASPPAWGAATNRSSVANANGNDLRHVSYTSVASSAGTSTPRFTATLGTTSTGPTAFLRLREAGPVTTPTAEVALGATDTPAARTGHTVRVRARALEGSGTLTYSLVEGTTVRATFTAALTAAFQTFAGALTEVQATAITSYSNLRVRWSATKTTAPLTAQVSWAELEAPGAPPRTGTATGSWSYTGAAVGARPRIGAATGSWAFTGTAAGVRPAVAVTAAQTSFEVAPAGTTIPVGTNDGDAFTVGTDGAGTTFTSESATPAAIAAGSLNAKITTGGTAAAAWRGWTLTPTGVLTARFYVYLTAYPASSLDLVALWQGGAVRARLRVTANGSIQHALANGAVFSGTSGQIIPLNTLTRIEAVWNLAAGTFVSDIYPGHSTTPVTGAALGISGMAYGVTTLDEVRMGMPGGGTVANYTLRTDAWAVNSSTTRIGPAATVPGQGSATGTFTFTGTAAGKRTPRATADGTWTFTGTAAGTRTPRGVAAGSWTFTGTAAGKKTPRATATGSWVYAGAAAGTAPTYPLAQTLTDTFDTATGWTLTAGATVTGGELVITPTTAYPRATNNGRFNILGSHFGGRLTQRPAGTSGVGTLLRVAIDATNTIELSVSQSGGVGATIKINNVVDSKFPGLVANATHYRIKVAADRVITWQAMVGGVWFTIRAGVTAPVGWDLSAVQVLVMAGMGAGDTTTAPARWTSVGIYNDVTPALTNTNVTFGAATGSAPPTQAEIDAITGKVGREPYIELWYRAWVNTISTTLLDQVRARGNVSLLTWEAWDWGPGNTSTTYNLPNITAGNFDTYITQTATTLRDWGYPIYLRPLHEMNHTAYPWCVGVNGNTVADFIPAWRHIRDIFTAVGATNVKFVWSPNQIAGANTLAPLYPGDSYCDVIALDAYNFGGAGWVWPANVFDGSFAEIRAITTAKPLWIGETASATVGGDKAQWVAEFFDWLRVTTDLDAYCWFDLLKEQDWRIDSSPEVQAAFTAGLATLDPSVPAGSGSGTVTYTGAATGRRTPKASTSGSWTFAGAAAGSTIRRGTAAGAWSFAGTTAGKRQPKATTGGTFTFTGAATGRTTRGGTAAGTLAWTSNAVGTAPVVGQQSGAASGAWSFTGAAAGKRAPRAAAGGTWTFAGTAAGKRAPRASTTGTWLFTGSGVGARPAAAANAAATGTWLFTGSSVGKRLPRATAAGTWAFTGTAAGRTIRRGSATGGWSFTGLGFAQTAFAAPLNLTVTAVSPTQINLSWAAVPNASGYDIERNGVIIATDHTATTYTDLGRSSRTAYTYRVRAVSAKTVVTPPATLPALPWDSHVDSPTTLAEEATFLTQLEAASPRVRIVNLGTSAQGRTIRAVIVGPPRSRDQIRASATALIQGSIHGDEWAGREAIFPHMLAHATGTGTETIVYIPTFNPDGVSIPQRNLANNSDPNRQWSQTGIDQQPDAGAYFPEQQCLRQAILLWRPRIIFDTHEYTSTGLTYRFDPGTINATGTPAAVVTISQAVITAMKNAATAAGYATANYGGAIPDDGMTQAMKFGGIPAVFTESPNESTGGLTVRRAMQLSSLNAFQAWVQANTATLATQAAAATWWSGFTPALTDPYAPPATTVPSGAAAGTFTWAGLAVGAAPQGTVLWEGGFEAGLIPPYSSTDYTGGATNGANQYSSVEMDGNSVAENNVPNLSFQTALVRNARSTRSLRIIGRGRTFTGTGVATKRAQFRAGNPTFSFTPTTDGDDNEYWFGFSFYLGTGYDLAFLTPSNFHNIAGPRQNTGSTFYITLQGNNGPGTVTMRRATAPDFPDGLGADQMHNTRLCVLNTWMDVVVHAKFSTTTTNALREFWVKTENESTWTHSGQQTTPNATVAGEATRFRFGLYTETNYDPDRHIYFDNVRIGTSFTAVDPSSLT